jgi:ribosomal-protein-alanine N-acetyltransferase
MLENDIPQVVAIEEKLYFRPWSNQSFIYAQKNYICTLFISHDEIAGYAILDKVDGQSQLLNFSIALEYQNQGIGTTALRILLKNYYKDLQIDIIYLEVNVSNGVAIKLYKKAGFKAMGRRLGYYQTSEGKQDAITMYHSKNQLIA